MVNISFEGLVEADCCWSGFVREQQQTPEPAIRHYHTLGRESSPFRYVGT
jgi:hypothetical protein